MTKQEKIQEAYGVEEPKVWSFSEMECSDDGIDWDDCISSFFRLKQKPYYSEKIKELEKEIERLKNI